MNATPSRICASPSHPRQTHHRRSVWLVFTEACGTVPGRCRFARSWGVAAFGTSLFGHAERSRRKATPTVSRRPAYYVDPGYPPGITRGMAFDAHCEASVLDRERRPRRADDGCIDAGFGADAAT